MYEAQGADSTGTAERSSHADGRYMRLALIWLVVLAALTVLPYLFDDAFRVMYVSEGGPIQVFSAAAYLVVIVSLIRETNPGFVRSHFYFVLIPLAMCLRELDFHVHFTPISITKTSFFVAPEIPLVLKAAAVGVYVGLGLCFVVMMKRHFMDYLRGLLRFDMVAVGVALAASFAILSKAIDGPKRKLAMIGIDINANLDVAATILEEVMELGIPVFMAIAVFAYVSRLRDGTPRMVSR